MFIMPMPKSFKPGDTADVIINGKAEKITWITTPDNGVGWLQIEPDDKRKIKTIVLPRQDGQTFYCADKE